MYNALRLARGHARPVVGVRLSLRAKATTANVFAHAVPISQRTAAQDGDDYLSGPGDDAGMT